MSQIEDQISTMDAIPTDSSNMEVDLKPNFQPLSAKALSVKYRSLFFTMKTVNRL